MAITKLKALGVTDGTLTNTQINASAAIAKTKLAALDIVNADVNASAAIAQSKMAALASTNMPAGNIIQVQHSSTTTTIADASGNYNGVLMTCNITPNFSSSKILISLQWYMGYVNPNGALRLMRDSTSIAESAAGYDNGTGFIAHDDVVGQGSASSYIMDCWSFIHLDSPNTTSQVAYKLQANSYYSMYFNRPVNDTYGYGRSNIILQEVKA